MSKADAIRADCLAHAKNHDEYQWAYLGKVNPKTGKMQFDCSGYVDHVMATNGILYKDGSTWLAGGRRPTTRTFKSIGTRVTVPRCGDVFLFCGSDLQPYHTGFHIGLEQTSEDRGEKWGVVNYSVNDPVNGVYARGLTNHGGGWFRFAWVDLGNLTGPPVSTTVTVPNWPKLYKGVHGKTTAEQTIISAAIKAYKGALNRLQAAGLDPNDHDFLEHTDQETRLFQKNPIHLGADGKKLTVDGEVGPNTRYAVAVALSKL